MLYVADTHALVRYLTGIAPPKINQIFESSEKGKCIIYIPSIVLAECFHLIKRKKIELDFEKLLRRIEEGENYAVVPFNIHILKMFKETKLMEIHDLIIVCTTKYLGAKLLTKDEIISSSGEVEVIW